MLSDGDLRRSIGCVVATRTPMWSARRRVWSAPRLTAVIKVESLVDDERFITTYEGVKDALVSAGDQLDLWVR